MDGSLFPGVFTMMIYFSNYLLVVTFLSSAFGKIAGFDDTLFYFVRIMKISFALLSSLLVILIIIEFLIPVLVCTNNLQSMVIYILIQILLIAFLITKILFFIQGIDNCGCFGSSFKSHPIIGVIKTVVLIMIGYYLHSGNTLPKRFKNRKIKR